MSAAGATTSLGSTWMMRLSKYRSATGIAKSCTRLVVLRPGLLTKCLCPSSEMNESFNVAYNSEVNVRDCISFIKVR